MARWEPDAPGRLAEAALELYAEHGFERTTVAGIAARAGLTERTFFRHFPDKREVLFHGSHDVQERLARAVADAPASSTPMATVCAALTDLALRLQENSARVRLREQVVAAHADLRERDTSKLARSAASVSSALRDRGVPDPTASLAAMAAFTAFNVAYARWVAEPASGSLVDLFGETLVALERVVTNRALAADGAPS